MGVALGAQPTSRAFSSMDPYDADPAKDAPPSLDSIAEMAIPVPGTGRCVVI